MLCKFDNYRCPGLLIHTQVNHNRSTRARNNKWIILAANTALLELGSLASLWRFGYWMIAYSKDFSCLLIFSINLLQGLVAAGLIWPLCESFSSKRSMLVGSCCLSAALSRYLLVIPHFETLFLFRHSKNGKLSPSTSC